MDTITELQERIRKYVGFDDAKIIDIQYNKNDGICQYGSVLFLRDKHLGSYPPFCMGIIKYIQDETISFTSSPTEVAQYYNEFIERINKIDNK